MENAESNLACPTSQEQDAISLLSKKIIPNARDASENTKSGYQNHQFILQHPTYPGYQPPNLGYHVGYPTYPGFPGFWEPSFWWNQAQQLLVPRGYAYESSQPLPFIASFGQPRGVIKIPEKLSQKHQRLWEAQLAENAQLWNVIGQPQVELADCKNRLVKLEAEASSSSKPAIEEPLSEAGNGSSRVAGRPAKRGRPKRAVASGSQPRARGRKPPLRRAKPEPKPTDQKVNLSKVEDTKKNHQSINQNNGNVETTAYLEGEVLQQFPGIQSLGNGFKSSPFSIMSQQTAEFISHGDVVTDSVGIIGEESEQEALNVACEAFYNSGKTKREGSYQVEDSK